MYPKIKHLIFTLLYLVLWAAFFFKIWDPRQGGLGLEQGLAIYQSWRPFLDILYLVTSYLMWPVYLLYGLVSQFVPQSYWFPYTWSSYLLQTIQSSQLPGMAALAQALNTPVTQKAFVGYFDWLIVIGVVFYSAINPLVDKVYDFLKNVVWNVLIEMSFTKRKEATYKDALEKRAADLMKLNAQYRNLSKEASQLAASVITDELTKVYNKRFFLEKIKEEFNKAKQNKSRLSIAMLDIDHFKKLNDNYGHLLGDKVLQAVAMVAKRATPKDCFCCRFGGEEFSIIMPGKTEQEALAIISVMHKNLPMLRFQEDAQLTTSASFGVAVINFSAAETANIKTFEDFIKLADDKLYQAKLNGRNRIEMEVIEPDSAA